MLVCRVFKILELAACNSKGFEHYYHVHYEISAIFVQV